MRAKAELADVVHETDFFAWSQDQARLLKSLRLVCMDLPAGLDIDNIAEEIEDLGKAELHAVESHVRNILVHLLKAVSRPDASSVPHWRAETTTFYVDLVQKYSRSMRQRIDMEKTWRLAMRVARDRLREHGDDLAGGLPTRCPFTVDQLVSDDFDFDVAMARLAGQIAVPPSD